MTRMYGREKQNDIFFIGQAIKEETLLSKQSLTGCHYEYMSNKVKKDF